MWKWAPQSAAPATGIVADATPMATVSDITTASAGTWVLHKDPVMTQLLSVAVLCPSWTTPSSVQAAPRLTHTLSRQQRSQMGLKSHCASKGGRGPSRETRAPRCWASALTAAAAEATNRKLTIKRQGGVSGQERAGTGQNWVGKGRNGGSSGPGGVGMVAEVAAGSQALKPDIGLLGSATVIG